MNILKFNFLPLTLFILFALASTSSCNSSGKKGDADNADSITPLIKDIIDLYDIEMVLHHVQEVEDQLIHYGVTSDTTEFNLEATHFISECDSMKQRFFFNDTLSEKKNAYLNLEKKKWQTTLTENLFDDNFQNQMKTLQQQIDSFDIYVLTRYSTDHFINLKEDDYWKNIDKSNFAKNPIWKNYKEKKYTTFKSNNDELQWLINNTENFQEKSIYKIELADYYLANLDSLPDSARVVISKYRSIIDAKEYSLFLFEAWLKCRTVNQTGILSLDSTGIIFENEHYEELRMTAFKTVLDYVKNNQDDEMAINECLLFATHEIILPYGENNSEKNVEAEYNRIFDIK